VNKLSTGFIHRCAKPVGIAQNYARYLTASIPSTRGSEPVSRIARGRCLMVLAVLCLVGTTPANATKEVKPSVDYLKLYAHSRIVKVFDPVQIIVDAEYCFRIFGADAVAPDDVIVTPAP